MHVSEWQRASFPGEFQNDILKDCERKYTSLFVVHYGGLRM